MAFSGTVSAFSENAVGETTVTLTVDHWYKGGTADVVTLTTKTIKGLAATTPASVSIYGVIFTQGKHYFVTPTNSTLNSCNFTGEANPNLEKTFAEAFPGS